MLPTADAILSPALEKFYELRPASFQHLNYRTGIYWHPFLGFRAQTAKMLRLLHDRVAANRFRTSTGQDLKDYVASEYDSLPDTGATFALGELSLIRTTSVTSGDLAKGTRFVRKANLTTQIPVRGAVYETLADVHFDVGQTTAGPIPIRAVTAGSAANHPIRTDSVPHGVTPVGGLFDKTIAVSTFSAAGGAEDASDVYVRRFAKAVSRGQYGPTEAEGRLGALSAVGVRQVLTYDQPLTGSLKILVGDSSWASSARWTAAVQQSMFDNGLVGFGSVVDVDVIQNKVVSLEANVSLRDINYLRDTADVDADIRKSVQSYLDDRSDWNVWKSNALRSVIARSHAKVYNCASVTMRDVDGNVLTEITSPDYTQPQYHYFLAGNAVKINYSGPA